MKEEQPITCQACGKIIPLEIDLTKKTTFVGFSMYCPNCKEERKELLERKEGCIYCGKIEGEIPGISPPMPICFSCREKKIKQAKAEDKCILCFVRPQLNVLDKGGDKVRFCEKCVKSWEQMIRISNINKKICSELIKSKNNLRR